MTNQEQSEAEQKKSTGSLPQAIVGIGSSAGGLEALCQFFSAMSTDSGMAFILVCHLDPHHDSMMPDLLSKQTRMTVKQIIDNQMIAANHVSIIPPNKELAIFNNRLQLLPRKKGDGNYWPIDAFLRSLARDQGAKAVGIILSGTGSDGTLGIKAIKEAGGLVIVQDKDSAKFSGMPDNARKTGMVDMILPPEKMAPYLLNYLKHNSRCAQKAEPDQDDKINQSLQKIFGMIRAATGHDFSLYKTNTIFRRIERRMYVRQMDTLKIISITSMIPSRKSISCSRNC